MVADLSLGTMPSIQPCLPAFVPHSLPAYPSISKLQLSKRSESTKLCASLQMQSEGRGLPKRRQAIKLVVLQTLAAGMAASFSKTPAWGEEVKLGDDEFVIGFGKGSLGIDLIEIRFPAGVPRNQQSSRVIVDAIKPGSQAETLGKRFRLRPQVLLVSVDGINIEGQPAAAAIRTVIDRKKLADEEGRVLPIVFRDPLIFKEKLLNSQNGSSVSTQVGVASSELLVINTTFVPEYCGAVRAQQGDLLEVKYTGYLADTMEIFDGSSITKDGGFFGDNSLFFVINQGQRQAPRAWEVGLLGMCIGEKRRLVVPPSLGYGKAGVPKGKIIPKMPVPPNAKLIYDVTLVGINGINVPTDDPSSLGTRIPYDYRDCKVEGRVTTCGVDVIDRRL